MHKKSTSRIWWIFLLVGLPWVSALNALSPVVPSNLQGPWTLEKGATILLFETDRLVSWRDGQLRVDTVLSHENGCLTIRHAGLIEHWRAVVEGEALTLRKPGEVQAFRRLDSVPDVVRLTPVSLGAPIPLSPERVAAIQGQLAERLQKDQEAIKNKAAKQEEVDAVIAANARSLLSLVQEIGWIDVQRFGSKASYAAVILAKHGGDLRLLLAALPFIERDFKSAGDDAQAFAIVYDSIQLDLGRKQRFGTQIRGVGEGKPFVLPLEDAARVDEYRKEIGLPPLAVYLSDASKVLQMEIAMPPAESLGGGWPDCLR